MQVLPSVALGFHVMSKIPIGPLVSSVEPVVLVPLCKLEKYRKIKLIFKLFFFLEVGVVQL
jgi:hypothetical protein